jgi:hypothetical protein
MKADPQLNDRRDLPRHPDPSAIGAVDTRQQLQQGALARSVSPHHAKELTSAHFERDIAKDLKVPVFSRPEWMGDPFFEGVGLTVGYTKALAEPPDLDRNGPVI